jgi:hypothetical protein
VKLSATPGYRGCYEGRAARDSVHHQDAARPWLLGAFLEAWGRVRGSSYEIKQEARRRCLEPLLDHAERIGVGTCQRSPTATRRMRRATVCSRLGRSARR